jgi:glutamine amidotransferase
MIAVIDYDMGNLRSVEKAFEKIGPKAMVTRDPGVIKDASHIVLPGVGAFKDCMSNLEKYGLIDPIIRSIEAGKPFLGICLGLQLLFDESSEFGRHKGLGLISGKVVRFPPHMQAEAPSGEGGEGGGGELKVPHMGWNDVRKKKDSLLLKDIPDGSFFYFVHSYYAVPDDEPVTLTATSYGVEFASSIEKDNITACQFHPEKSQKKGLKVLKNFSEIS